MTARTILALAALAWLTHLALADPGDFELIVPGWSPWLTPICAKSAAGCREELDAITAGRSSLFPPGSATRCVPHPNCFSEKSNTIKGYNR